MKKLLEAINRGILKGLSENNIELLTDLDDSELDLDSIQTKSVNSKIQVKYFPKTKDELVKIIKSEVEKNGWNCDLNHIDVSKIKDMSMLFGAYNEHGYDLEKFNGDISKWDVSNVTNMRSMFKNSEFNGDISDWNVSNVREMYETFMNSKFNQDISNWDVSNVTDMQWMFFECPLKDEYKPKFKK